MTKALSDRQIAQYHRDGCLSPLPVFFRNEITGLFAKFSELQQREGGTISGPPTVSRISFCRGSTR